jgi:ATP-dependent RNA helicase RhlE
MKRSLRDIEKLVGLNLPKENIRGFEPDPNASKNQSNKDKEDNNAIQLRENQKPQTTGNSNNFWSKTSSQNNDRRSNR